MKYAVGPTRRLRLRRATSTPTQKDWWDKASIISSFVSSVALAGVGLLISYSIQTAQIRTAAANAQAQIEASAIRAREQQRLQEGELTGQLLQHLVSKDSTQREIAVIALRNAVPQTTYDSIVEVLARSDSSSVVRSLAIKQLGGSASATAPTTLNAIALDASRSTTERQLAAESTIEIGVRETLQGTIRKDASVVVLAAATARGLAFETRDEEGRVGGVFTNALRAGLRGKADLDHDDLINTSELRSFVAVEVAKEFPMQTPVVLSSSDQDVALAQHVRRIKRLNDTFTVERPPASLPYRQTHGLFIGTVPKLGHYADLPTLEDATAMAELFAEVSSMNTEALVGDNATEGRVTEAINRLSLVVQPDDLFVLYYAGVAIVTKDGTVRWLLSDSTEQGGLTAPELSTALNRIRATHKVLLIDSSHAAAIAESGGLTRH